MFNWKGSKKIALLLASTAALSACGGGGVAEEGTEVGEVPDLDDNSLWIYGGYPPHSTVGTVEDSPFHQGLIEKTGLDIEWQFATEGTDGDQAYNLMITQEVLPDLIWHSWMHEASQAIEEGIIRDLTDELPEKAPNYWQYLQDNPEIDRAMRTDDGQYYMFSFYREEPFQSVYQGPIVRQDWLEEQNLPIPETIEDWDNTIEVFNEEYGARFSFLTNWRMSPGLAGAFGAYGSFEPRFFVQDDEIHLAQAQPEWRDYMEWLHDLHSRGLVDADFVTLDDQGMQTKAAQEEVGISVMNGGSILTYNNDAQTNDTGAEWIGIQYPNQADGSPSAAIFAEDMYVAQGYAISTSIDEDRLDNAYKFLDWAFSEEGYQYWNFGTEGESWEMVDGEPTFTDLVENHELGKDTGIALYTGNIGYGLGVQAARFIEMRTDEASYEAAFNWSDGMEEAIAANVPAAVTMTASESREDSNLTNTLNTYVLEESIKFVTGERSLDEFDNFVSELEDIGLDRMLEIRNTAYQRYLDR